MFRLTFVWRVTLLAAVLITSACASSAPAVTVPASSTPTAPVPSTAPQGATPAAQPTSAAATPRRGGRMTLALWQSPATLNNLLATSAQTEVTIFISEGLTQLQPDGSREGLLATAVPTVANGGLSADGKTITYKLLPDVVFSDGSPFGCEDVKFTWQVRMTPGVGIVSTTGYDQIESISCPDPLTVVLKMKSYYAPYATLFPDILPRNAGDPKNIKNWAYNRKPIGTGPFKLDEWVADDHITLSRNEKYREPGKPYLDQVVIRILPSVEVALSLLESGELDAMYSPKIDQIPALNKIKGAVYAAPPRPGGEKLFLNMAENKDPADPTKPHAILGDQRVRQALAIGTNWTRMRTELMYGAAKPSPTDLSVGFWKCDIPEYKYDPDKAKALLTEAGWVPGADGIRVAKGSKYAADGTRLRLKIMTISGDKLRENEELLIVQDMRAIGMEIYVENAPSSIVAGTWESGAPRVHGNFDIILVNAFPDDDPHAHMERFWASWQIPSEKNKGGGNYTRFNDPKADELLKKAATELDMGKRKEMYCQLAQMTYEQVNMIGTYQGSRPFAYRSDRLVGWVPNAWHNMGWDAENWWVVK